MTSTAIKFSFTQLATELERVRTNTPLVHVLTNEVVQCFTANTLLAVGASPAMVVAQEEVADFAALADAVLINIGTLYPERLAAMQAAIASANAAGTPWVLDPVAVGALRYRTEAAKAMLASRPAAIRGNGSEIIALAGGLGGGKGVDSTASSASAVDAALALARSTGAIVAVTGAIDYITSLTTIVGIAARRQCEQRQTLRRCAPAQNASGAGTAYAVALPRAPPLGEQEMVLDQEVRPDQR
ncbi:hydroxyethylthiazole kinase [Chitinibacter tainanensis]|uniref:hydroxyethylthiazole kinase n=1 Tax=Chitinibacter tainanensis TaxID=230667 RepID=UPI002352669F|nr:hydroxyethylthiazole kinase [Chitinibacter tainanensis]